MTATGGKRPARLGVSGIVQEKTPQGRYCTAKRTMRRAKTTGRKQSNSNRQQYAGELFRRAPAFPPVAPHAGEGAPGALAAPPHALALTSSSLTRPAQVASPRSIPTDSIRRKVPRGSCGCESCSTSRPSGYSPASRARSPRCSMPAPRSAGCSDRGMLCRHPACGAGGPGKTNSTRPKPKSS